MEFSQFHIPPHNSEAEMSVLGSLLIDNEAIIKVVDSIDASDFYHDAHKKIYQVCLELFEKRQPIDLLSVSSRLREKKILEEIGDLPYLTKLVNITPTSSNVAAYAEIVQRKRILRDLISTSTEINQLGHKEDEDIEVLLDEAEQKIFRVSQRNLRQSFLPVRAMLEDAWERIDRLHKGGGELRGIPTGFPEIDNILSGFQRGDFVILAARPSFGKTALALDIARNMAVRHNIPVGLFSLEMSQSQIIDRFIAAEAFIDLWRLRTGRLSPEDDDFRKIRDALERLNKAPIYIDDAATNNVLQMRAMARRLQAECRLGLIVIDYLQLIQPRTNSDNIVQQITEISRSLKALAKELDVPVLALSQLSRAVEHRPKAVPRLSDLRESGSLEQDADVVLFIYREDRYREETQRKNQADIIIAKHRNGPLGKVALYFNAEKASFSSLEGNIPDFPSSDFRAGADEIIEEV